MNKKLTGALLATAVAGMFLAGNAFAAGGDHGHTKEAKTVKCWGANACKGHGACKTSENACSGKNGCKGKSWTNLTEEECKAKGGTTKE